MSNSIINSSGANTEILVPGGVNGGFWNFTNVSHTKRTYSASSNGTLLVSWYVTMNVTNSSGLPVQNANVTLNNTYDNILFNELTNANGYTTIYLLREVNMTTSTTPSLNPHKILINASGYNYYTRDINLSYSGIYNLVLTIQDKTNPLVVILSPANITYTTQTIYFNVSLNENGSCVYSLNSGITNYTMTANAFGTGFNAVNSSIADGSYIVNAYCMDSAGNINNSVSVVFSKDTSLPQIKSKLLLNRTEKENSLEFYVQSNKKLNLCKISMDDWLTNYSMSLNSSLTEANYTHMNISDGNYNAKFWCNDTLGIVNNLEQILFTIDTIPPNISIIYPQNISYIENISELNYSIEDVNLQSCWYSIDNGTNNYSMICGENITNLTSNNSTNIWYVYSNDSMGNIGWSFVSFFLNRTIPADLSLPAGSGGSSSGGGGSGGSISSPPSTSSGQSSVTGQSGATTRFTTSIVKRNVSNGTSGEDIRRLQQALNNFAVSRIAQSGVGSPGNETTFFGSLTESAVQRFQCNFMAICSGTPQTNGYGFVGPKTRATLDVLTGVAVAGTDTTGAVSTTAPTPSATSNTNNVSGSFTRELALGTTDAQVTLLQQRLAGDTSLYPEKLVTGFYGTLTQLAVERFQCRHLSICSGTPQTNGYGFVGPQTRSMLNEIYAGGLPTATVQPSTIPTPTVSVPPIQVTVNENSSFVLFGQTLKAGDQGKKVEHLQEILARDKTIYPEGFVTGIFSPLTEIAVRRFQCVYLFLCSGTPQTNGYGLVGPSTQEKLKSVLGE